MNKPLKYIISSDYSTLANDSVTITGVLNIPATTIGGGGSYQTYSTTIEIGTIGSPIEYDINYSMSSQRWRAQRLFVVENAGASGQYELIIFIYKSAPTTVTIQAIVFRGGSGSVTKNARTITVRVRSFIPPFG